MGVLLRQRGVDAGAEGAEPGVGGVGAEGGGAVEGGGKVDAVEGVQAGRGKLQHVLC